MPMYIFDFHYESDTMLAESIQKACLWIASQDVEDVQVISRCMLKCQQFWAYPPGSELEVTREGTPGSSMVVVRVKKSEGLSFASTAAYTAPSRHDRGAEWPS